MGIFSDHIAKIPGTLSGAKSYVQQNRADYNNLHGKMPNAREYINSDAGRAAARHSVGTGISRFLTQSTSKNFRRGNFVMGTLLTFAGHALATHMVNLKHDQRIFENVARVRRGDPDVGQMTHNELREVMHHSERFGGQDHKSISEGAIGELTRRHVSKGQERGLAKVTHDNIVHENRLRQRFDAHAKSQETKEAAHANRMRRLRETAGHTHEARVASAEKIAQIKKGVEVAKTKGVQARQTSIRATHRSKLHLLKKTKSGGYYQGENGKKFYQSDEKMKKAATAPKGRKRAV